MSSQPSTIDNVKDSATSTYSSLADGATTSSSQNQNPNYDPNADSSNFSKDAHGNTFKKGDYKDQLNQAATGDLNKETPELLKLEKPTNKKIIKNFHMASNR